MVRSGRWAKSWAARRVLLVPTTAPDGKVANVQPLRATRASRTSARVVMAPKVRPGLSSTGRSFSEWTAMSMRPSHRASSSSAVNNPLPPIAGSALPCAWVRSPWVIKGSMRQVRVGQAACRRLMIWLLCHKARSEVRLPRMSVDVDIGLPRTFSSVLLQPQVQRGRLPSRRSGRLVVDGHDL